MIILPNLTPTTALTVYLRDAQQTGPAAPAEFTVPEGVEVVFQLEEGRAAKTVITEGHFGLLPKGVDLPVTLSRGRWGLAGIDPSKCSASGGSAVKAGCRVIWLRLQPSESAPLYQACRSASHRACVFGRRKGHTAAGGRRPRQRAADNRHVARSQCICHAARLAHGGSRGRRSSISLALRAGAGQSLRPGAADRTKLQRRPFAATDIPAADGSRHTDSNKNRWGETTR